MIINFCAEVIFCSVLVMWFFTNCRLISHLRGQVRYESAQLKITTISNNVLTLLELTLIFLMHQSNQSSVLMIALNILLAIALVTINLFLTFVIEPTEVENHFISDHEIHHKKQPLVSKTVNELLLMTNKNH